MHAAVPVSNLVCRIYRDDEIRCRTTFLADPEKYAAIHSASQGGPSD